ncbi:hypothetical protein D3C77_410250 [compost metagenome]
MDDSVHPDDHCWNMGVRPASVPASIYFDGLGQLADSGSSIPSKRNIAEQAISDAGENTAGASSGTSRESSARSEGALGQRAA